MNILDSQGRIFEHDYRAEIWEDDMLILEQLQPGLPKSGKIVFDVPEDIVGCLKISSDNLTSNEMKYIFWNESA